MKINEISFKSKFIGDSHLCNKYAIESNEETVENVQEIRYIGLFGQDISLHKTCYLKIFLL